MANQTFSDVTIQIRRDSASNWSTENPVLADGELGFEKDTGKSKCGDGTTAWNSLPYMYSASTVAWNDITGKPTFATVATSGDYTDLSNTPTIPTKVSDLTNDTGFITGVAWNDVTGKPSTFTPSTHDHDSTYLKLTGGTMTGSIMFTNSNNRRAGIDLNNSGNNFDIGWNWANRDGAGFYLRSTDFNSSTGGGFGAYARNASNSYDLFGNASTGALTWNGTSFSVGGGTGTITGNITANVLTGYAKPSSTSAIAATDTLNGAIGKLEKALDGKQASGSYASSTHDHDSTYLKLSGGTMTGKITLSTSGLEANNSGGVMMDQFGNLKFKSGAVSSNFWNVQDSSGKYVFGVGQNGLVQVGTNATPATYNLSVGGTLNATGTITQNGTAVSLNGHTHSYLPLSGGTLTGSLTLQGNGLNITHKQTAWTRGTAPSANAAIWMCRIIDSAGKDMGGLYKWIGTDKSSKLILYNYTHANNTGGAQGIAVCHDSSGNFYTEAPTPATTDSSTKMATTAYVKACVPKTVGSASIPVYSNSNGVITVCTSLDASKLTGTVPSGCYTNTNNISASSVAASGYTKFNNGMTIQWGTITGGSTSTNFPVSFGTACCGIFRGGITSTNAAANHLDFTVQSVSKTGFTHSSRSYSTNYYIAIGY